MIDVYKFIRMPFVDTGAPYETINSYIVKDGQPSTDYTTINHSKKRSV